MPRDQELGRVGRKGKQGGKDKDTRASRTARGTREQGKNMCSAKQSNEKHKRDMTLGIRALFLLHLPSPIVLNVVVEAVKGAVVGVTSGRADSRGARQRLERHICGVIAVVVR